MNFRFHILDRNNVSTEIEEPVGFDGMVCQIGRDADWHGIFFTTSGENFEFYGTAMKLLKAEYELYGAQGDMTLIMEQECNGVWTEFARESFIFSKYEYHDDDCYVVCPLEAIGEIMNLRNRVDQKVNLDSLKGFDEITNLSDYSKLGFDVPLPSKGIFMQDKAEIDIPATTNVKLPTGLSDVQFNNNGAANYNYAWFQIVPQFDQVDLSEFGSFTTSPTPENSYIKSGWYDQRQIQPFTDANGNLIVIEAVVEQNFPSQRWIYFDWRSATALLMNDNFGNNFNAVKSFSGDIDFSFDVQLINANILSLYAILVIQRADGTYEYLDKNQIMNGVPGGGYAGFNSGSIWLAGSTNNISFSASHSDISLGNGDSLFVAVVGLAAYSNFDARDGLDAFNIIAKTGSVNMQSLTHFDTTTSKFYAVNEAISRISESITNDKLRAYSEYFGRTDSQPYAVREDGCGSLEVITNGIRIRGQENKTPGQTDIFSQSMQDMFDGLCPIHNIGMGIETDTNRAGYNRLRVEPWTHFYNDTLVMSCSNVDAIVRKTNDKEIYSTFQFGYDKWEAEEYNGLDEFLTKRNYRTALSQVKNDFSQISKFIASGYALEITRRQGNDNTKDWRYDNDTFIVCVKRGDFVVSVTKFSITVSGNPAPTIHAGDTIVFSGGPEGTFTVSTVFNQQSDKVVFTTTTPVAEGYYTNTGISVNGSAKTANSLMVELGNVSNPVNIVDPDTLYNFRISPIRNAMRWMNKVLATYRQFDAGSKIIFTDGDGNYFAQGEMTDAGCRLENAALTENQTIDSSVFANAADAKPIMFPERDTFTYPFTAQDYVNIKANPGGKIFYQSDKISGYGWIDSINWNPDEGTAQFSIIPKFTN